MDQFRKAEVGRAPWFAWRPVKTTGGRWVWLKTVERAEFSCRAGDSYFWMEYAYALLP